MTFFNADIRSPFCVHFSKEPPSLGFKMLRHTAACGRHSACACVLCIGFWFSTSFTVFQCLPADTQAFLSYLLTLCWKTEWSIKSMWKPGCSLLKCFPDRLCLSPTQPSSVQRKGSDFPSPLPTLSIVFSPDKTNDNLLLWVFCFVLFVYADL